MNKFLQSTDIGDWKDPEIQAPARSIATYCLLVLNLFVPRVAWCDLYTGTARSTDWLVDSSDEIVHLQVVRQGEADLEPIVVGTLKGRLTPDEFREATAPEARPVYRIHKKDDGISRFQFRYALDKHWLNAGWRCERPAEWLLLCVPMARRGGWPTRSI